MLRSVQWPQTIAGVSQDECSNLAFPQPHQAPLAATEDIQGGGLREELLPSLQLLDILGPLAAA